MSLTILAPLLAFLFLLAIQGFLLQTAVALTGDPAPRYFPALGTAIVATLASIVGATVWSWTFGWFFWFFSSTLASVITIGVSFAITTAVVSRRLSLSGAHAAVVALAWQIMAAALSYALWSLLAYLSLGL